MGRISKIDKHVLRHAHLNLFQKMQIYIQNAFERGFDSVGGFIAKHKILVICIYSVLAIVSLLGMTQMSKNSITDLIKLFTPSTGEVWTEKSMYNDYYTAATDSFSMIFVPKVNGTMFQKDILREVLEYNDEVMNIVVNNKTYSDICTKLLDGSCSHITPYMYFDYKLSTYDNTDESAIISTMCNSEKNYIPYLYVFGTGGNVTADNCMDSTYGIQGTTAINVYLSITIEDKDKTMMENWLSRAHSLADHYRSINTHFDIYDMSSKGMSSEVNRGTVSTIPKFIISLVLVFFFLLFSLHEHYFTTTILIDIACLGSVLVALGFGLGFSLWCTIPWTTISIVIAFLAVGLGVDNCVLISVMFFRTSKYLSFTDRNRLTLSKAGLFISLTSFTTILAFLMSLNSSFSGIVYFALSSSIVMLLLYLTCFTFFDCLLLYIMKRDLNMDIRTGLIHEDLIGLVSIDQPDWAEQIYILETTHSKKAFDMYKQSKELSTHGDSPSPPSSPLPKRSPSPLPPFELLQEIEFEQTVHDRQGPLVLPQLSSSSLTSCSSISSFSSYDSYTSNGTSISSSSYDTLSPNDDTNAVINNKENTIQLPKNASTLSSTITVSQILNKQDNSKPVDNGFLTRLFTRFIGPLYEYTAFYIAVIIVFIALIASSFYFCTKITQGIKPKDAVPYDSYVIEYLNTATIHFEEKLTVINVVFSDTDFSRITIRRLISEVAAQLPSIPYALTNIENPWDLFDKWCVQNNKNPDEQEGLEFYFNFIQYASYNPRVLEKLSLNLTVIEDLTTVVTTLIKDNIGAVDIGSLEDLLNGNFDKVVIDLSKVNIDQETLTKLSSMMSSGEIIRACTVTMPISQVLIEKFELGKDTMNTLRNLLNSYNAIYRKHLYAFSYSSNYHYFEMVGVTFTQTIINLITSAIAIVIVLILFLPPFPAFLAIISVCLADVCILGWIPVVHLDLNAITSTCLVLSVGIAVDFSAHMTHSFVHTTGTGPKRARASIEEMGRSLFTSGLTTFFGVFMLAFAPVPTNQAFFSMMSGVILFGMLFGMVLLPTLFALFNPKKQIEYDTVKENYIELKKEKERKYKIEVEEMERKKEEEIKMKEQKKLLRKQQYNNYSAKHIKEEA